MALPSPRAVAARLTGREARACLGFTVAFLVWTTLVHASVTDHLDALAPAPVLRPRSAPGQVAETIALLTHPLVIYTAILAAAVITYQRRMRRLATALATSLVGLPLQLLVAGVVDHQRPSSAFADSISYHGYAYPSAAAMAITLGAWVLVTLTRANRRPSSQIRLWAVLAWTTVIGSCAAQWVMGLHLLSDLVGGVLLGAAVATLALWVGGIDEILAGWAHLGLATTSVDRRAAVVYNPTKFDDLSLLRRRVESEVLSAGWEPTLWLETTADDPGRAMAHQALEAGADLVLVAGGDGTVRAVAGELAGTRVPVGLLPSGTGNLLARNLGVPIDTDAALRLALTGRPAAIDVVRAHSDDGDTTFTVMAGLGLDAQIMESTNDELKKVIRSGAYVLAAAQNASPDPFTVTVRTDDGHTQEHRAVMALVGNVGTITGGLTLFPDATPTDGRIDLLLANPDRVVDWAKLGAGLLTGTDVKGLDYLQARCIEMRLDRPVPFELDGDTAGRTDHLTMRVEPGALHVVVPEGSPALSAPTDRRDDRRDR